MRRIFGFLMVLCMTMFGIFAYAQEAAAEVVSNESVFKALFDLIMGYKGLQGAALTVAIAQFILLFCKSHLFEQLFKKLSGAWKLTIVSLLTLVIGVFSMKAAGMTTAQALSDSANLVALQVLVHQLFSQFFIKKV